MMLGSLYNKTFKEKLQALDEAVCKLQDRVSILRDLTTKATLQRVESTDVKVTSMTEDLETMARSQDETHMKIDHLSDLHQAKAEANQAMKLVLEETTRTSECKPGLSRTFKWN